MKIGLVSVTFRQLNVKEIIEFSRQADIDGIEWGSDIHCSVGDINTANDIAKLMNQNNLETISYGSYYRTGDSNPNEFDAVLESAIVLKSPNIRVWAGNIDSENATSEYRQNLIADCKRIADLASLYNITISFEYHGSTLTNTQSSCVKLLNEIDRDNVLTYWQPLANTTHQENIDNIKELISINKLNNIHAYHWVNAERLELSEGKALWQEYINATQNEVNAILLEFVKNDSTEQFFKDIKTLKSL